MGDQSFDVVIIGARVAGSILAARLGDGGMRVLLVDKAAFPSLTMVLQWFGQPISVEGAVEYLLIGHPADHLTSIQKAFVR